MNRSSLRVTVGASEVRSGVMRYFDTRDQAMTIDHILASSALPPAFPAVRIDGELYLGRRYPIELTNRSDLRG